ncbi:hypothetical protein QYE76_003978 [Lolium multiflorum]|uniref:Uncharacterized protein n=1 Tax=Lolium multiflorum TaxID=4521 RepID=A0AAD8RR33_LOLMU|nr:hypothetical protein QYE76_003978 [Lolium multiflorum]
MLITAMATTKRSTTEKWHSVTQVQDPRGEEKEIMAEQDGNNGSPKLLAPPELLDEEEAPEWLEEKEMLEMLEAGEALELLRGQEIMAEAEEEPGDGDNGSTLLLQAEEEAPEWLQVLIRARVWEGCMVHPSLSRAEKNVFCLHCIKIICPRCRHAEDEPSHQLLKIRHYVYRSVLSTRDMYTLGVDVSYIQEKEIMAEQDGNNGSPKLLAPPELLDEEEAPEWLKEKEMREMLEAGEALELLRGQEIMAEAEEEPGDGDNGSTLLLQAEEEAPEWLQVLIRARVWEGCMVHPSLSRAEKNVFCLHCIKIICPRCRHAEDEPSHQLLKIRHYVYRSVLSTRDMYTLGVDVSYIQTYKSNGHYVVHLRPMKKSDRHRARQGTPRCITCNILLNTLPNRFCSLSCKYRVHVEPAASDDLSGHRPSRRRLGSQDAQGEVTSPHPDA